MKTQYNIKEINYTSIANCTRLMEGLLSKNGVKPTTIQDIYDKFEETYHWAETYGRKLFPNEDYRVRCKKVYQDVYEEAIWRLKRILDKGKGKSELKYLVISDYPQDDRGESYHYSENGYSAFRTNKHGNTLDTLELAFIIDDMLSLGDSLSNDDIYKKLDEIFHLASLNGDYAWNCRQVYRKISSQAIQYIIDELKSKKREDILKILPFPDDKRKNLYQYEEIGFSAFKSPMPQDIHPLEIRFETFVRGLYLQNKTKTPEHGNIDEPTKGVEATTLSLERLYEILREVDISVNDSEQNYTKTLGDFILLKNNRSRDWVSQCSRLLIAIIKEYKDKMPSLVYADFLIEYADFIATVDIDQEELSKEIDESIFDYSQSLYESAITRAREYKDKERLALFMVKYGEFLNKNRQFHLVGDQCEKAISIYLKLISGNSDYLQGEYASALHLYGNYHYNISEFEMAEKYYNEVYEIRSRLSEADPEKYEHELAKTINNLANLYKRQNNIDRARELYEESLRLREQCTERNPQLYEFDKASSLYNIGSLYMKLDRYDEAITYVQKALEIEERLVERSPEVYEYLHSYSNTLETLSHLYYIQDDYSKAEQLCQTAISNIEGLVQKNQKGFEKSYADILVHLSSVHQRLGEYDDADDEIHRALDIFQKLAIKFVGKYEEDIVYALRVIADNYCQRAQYVAAEEPIDKAMKISERLYSEDKSAYARLHAISLYQRASIYTLLTEYDAAERLYIESLAIFEEMQNMAPEISKREQLIVKGYLADLYRHYKGEYENALPKYEELVEEYKALIATNNSVTLQLDCAHLLSRLADCYEGMGERVMYKNALKGAIAFYNTIQDETIATKTRIATLHLSLALAYSVDEEYEESFGYYQKAIDLYSYIYQSNPVSVTEYLGMAHRYYALSLEEDYEDKAVEQYSYSLRYYLEDSIYLGKSATDVMETFDEIFEYIDRNVIFKYLYNTCPEACEGFLLMMEHYCDELNDKTRYQETLKNMISLYRTIEEDDPDLNETIAHKLLLLALSYGEDEEYEESFEYFEEAISIYEDELRSNGVTNIEHLAIAYKCYALSRQSNEEYDEAIKLYEKSFNCFINNAQSSGDSIEEIDEMLEYIMSIDFENMDEELICKIVDSCQVYQNYLTIKNKKLAEFITWLESCREK